MVWGSYTCSGTMAIRQSFDDFPFTVLSVVTNATDSMCHKTVTSYRAVVISDDIVSRITVRRFPIPFSIIFAMYRVVSK